MQLPTCGVLYSAASAPHQQRSAAPGAISCPVLGSMASHCCDGAVKVEACVGVVVVTLTLRRRSSLRSTAITHAWLVHRLSARAYPRCDLDAQRTMPANNALSSYDKNQVRRCPHETNEDLP